MSLGFFFSIRRRHTMCALGTGVQTCSLPIYGRCGLALQAVASKGWTSISGPWMPGRRRIVEPDQAAFWHERYAPKDPLYKTMPNASVAGDAEDRKSVVKGKSVSVRVDLGGRRILNTHSHTPTCQTNPTPITHIPKP